MPRSMSCFSENPVLRVSRPVSACSRCRNAKVKCDGKLPACTACEKAGRENECSAANDQFVRGKERSYVAALELRIEKLERRLAYARSRKASVALHDSEAPVAAANGRKDSLAHIRAAIHRKEARTREESDVNSLVSDFGYLSVNATTRDFEPSVANMNFARLVLAAATNDPVPLPTSDDLPPRYKAYALAQYYMTNIYPLFPAFPEENVATILHDMYSQEPPPIKTADYWLIYMILAIASASQSQQNTDQFYADGVDFVTRALPYADTALLSGYPQIPSLILLTQYSMLDPAHFDCWHLIGFTCRAVIDLGLHQDPREAGHIDKMNLDDRRRIFYSVYALDRAISMVHARAFSFTNDAIAVALPSALERSARRTSPSLSSPVSASTSADPAPCLSQIRRIQSNWHQTLFQSDARQPLPDATSYVWQMCHEMQEWFDKLPANLPANICQLFDLDLRFSFVYCIAPSPRAPHMTPYRRVLVFEHAMAYVDRIFDIAYRPTSSSPPFYTYHDVLRVYLVASHLITVLNDPDSTVLSSPNIAPPLAAPGAPAPPPIPRRTDTVDNVERSLICLDRILATLQKLGERWTDALKLMNSFDIHSAKVRQDLETRRNMRSASSSQTPRSPPTQSPQSPLASMQSPDGHHMSDQVPLMGHAG